MSRTVGLVLLLGLLQGTSLLGVNVTGCTDSTRRPPSGPPPREALWNVLIYMNGDNNLESAALADFDEIARVESSPDVNVLLQMDLLHDLDQNPNRTAAGTWRYRMTKGIKRRDVTESLDEVDMGNPASFECFVRWARCNYPAKNTVLVVWDHGQGWRDPLIAEQQGVLPARQDTRRSALESPFKSVSHDDTSRTELYNRAIVEALRRLRDETPCISGSASRVDVLAFDACLMAMIETAYAFRDVAEILVASQELVPNAGFDYADWLGELVKAPSSYDARGLGKLLVESYQRTYDQYKLALYRDQTLSAIDLGAAVTVADRLSALGTLLDGDLARVKPAVQAARTKSPKFAPRNGRYHHVDLDVFLEQLLATAPGDALKTAARSTREALAKAVIATYSGPSRTKGSARGLCVYFPVDRAAYYCDTYKRDGYEEGQPAGTYPLEFVDTLAWDNFLRRYWGPTPFGGFDCLALLPKFSTGGDTREGRPPTTLKALVIGNSAYQREAPLASRNDAAGMNDALVDLGFDVILSIDADRAELRESVDLFLGSINKGDTAVVAYSGHGLQLDGTNFLVPVDAAIAGPLDVRAQTYSLDEMLVAPRFAEAERRIVILDACRRNPWNADGRVFQQGLAQVRVPPETMVAFAAEPGGRAADADLADWDGVDRSPYSLALLRFLRRPGLPVEELFKRTRDHVLELTSYIQKTSETTSLQKSFVFRPGASIRAALTGCDDVILLRHQESGKDVLRCPIGGAAKELVDLVPGDNHFTVFVFNQHTFEGGFTFRKPEGWKYSLALLTKEGKLLDRWDEGEDHPPKNGPRHGAGFDAARFVIHVDDGDPSAQGAAAARVFPVFVTEKKLGIWKSAGL